MGCQIAKIGREQPVRNPRRFFTHDGYDPLERVLRVRIVQASRLEQGQTVCPDVAREPIPIL